jgi:hypothetical protein
MKEFLELGKLYEQIKTVIASKKYREIELPQTFKSQLSVIGDRTIEYHKFTAIAYKNNADSIIIPNYWFYLATDIHPFNVEIHRYYEQVMNMNLFTPDRLSELKTKKLTEKEQWKIYSSFDSNQDAERICRFLTNYRWWHGGKELGRVQKDYYVSAVLSLSGLVNDSSTFLAAICEVIREKPQLSEILVDFYNKGNITIKTTTKITPQYIPFVTAIKSKPFLLLAGISGTGKSRIVRELARACWDVDSDEYKAQKPRNFEMVQVKPNWHDSSELIGYVSRIDGVRYVIGPFLKFMVKAMQDPETPYFLCLDEMNLAPVEQYFAEYLSVVESRKQQEDGSITTDPIIDYSNTDEYKSLIDQLFPDDEELRIEYLTEKSGKRLSIPTNLSVVGTVNMDETTFSFSRKVLDRAMTIEMNEVDLKGGLKERYEQIGKLGAAELIGTYVEGVDVYGAYQSVCDKVISYLEDVNKQLEGTPFKIAYRTRNEALLYVVNNLPYKQDGETEDYVINRALDEITNMKILSRIEGDADKIGNLLERLTKVVKEQLGEQFTLDNSASLRKLDEMERKLKSGYTSFWS